MKYQYHMFYGNTFVVIPVLFLNQFDNASQVNTEANLMYDIAIVIIFYCRIYISFPKRE